MNLHQDWTLEYNPMGVLTVPCHKYVHLGKSPLLWLHNQDTSFLKICKPVFHNLWL